MIVATRFWRYFLMQFLCFMFYSTMQAMVWDNRYFPWFDQLYTGSDSRHGYIDVNAFCVIDRDAFRFDHRAIKDEQVVWLPELWGELNVSEVGISMTAAGLLNPIPEDWQWFHDFSVLLPSRMDGQGVALACYTPIGDHFGIGANTFVMKLNSFVTAQPSADAIKKLNLTTPGNQALFTEMMNQMYKELGITGTSIQEVGVGDIVVYGCIHDTHEYKYKFRKLDWGAYVGLLIPTGTQQSPYNLASIPLGGGYGLWGWFVAPFAEFELKDDWIFGFELRLTQRIDRCFTGRIPVGKEQYLFAPLVGNVNVNSGITVSFAPYVAFQDLRAGFGAQVKYTLTMHENDVFSANISNLGLNARFGNASYYSGWTQEYLTVRLFYDIAHDKTWNKKPMAYLTWDIPMNHIAGRGFAKTNRISLGCIVNF